MLEEKLRELALSDQYPFHMPGHKRRGMGLGEPYEIDITEIADFDNLHQPEGILKEMMQQIAALYHADTSYLLINGSTGGNLAAIFAATRQRDTIIIGRNCHKSVYHGAELRELTLVYTYPEISPEGIILGTPLEEYEKAIRLHPKAKALVVTSPTYEGVTEPLEEIVALAHAHHMAVIIDAAHGAHLGFDSYFPPSPLRSGADLVVMSFHKTLPALTQTGVLHYKPVPDETGKPLVARERVEKYLSVFQTSSPSYVLMASVSRCIRYLQENPSAFLSYGVLLRDFYKKAEDWKYFRIFQREGQDPSKIVIDTSSTHMSGYELQKRLREEYHLELEMSSFCFGLAMTSIMDTPEGMERLYQSLDKLEQEEEALQSKDGRCSWGESKAPTEKRLCFTDRTDLKMLYAPGESVMELWEAAARETEAVPFLSAAGRIAAREVTLYPPGIPVLVPGERIMEEKLFLLRKAREQGLTITGLYNKPKEALFVVI